jgi:hypothetical protein
LLAFYKVILMPCTLRLARCVKPRRAPAEGAGADRSYPQVQ